MVKRVSANVKATSHTLKRSFNAQYIGMGLGFLLVIVLIVIFSLPKTPEPQPEPTPLPPPVEQPIVNVSPCENTSFEGFTTTLKWYMPLNDSTLKGYKVYYGETLDLTESNALESIDVGRVNSYSLKLPSVPVGKLGGKTYYMFIVSYQTDGSLGKESDILSNYVPYVENVNCQQRELSFGTANYLGITYIKPYSQYFPYGFQNSSDGKNWGVAPLDYLLGKEPLSDGSGEKVTFGAYVSKEGKKLYYRMDRPLEVLWK